MGAPLKTRLFIIPTEAINSITGEEIQREEAQKEGDALF